MMRLDDVFRRVPLDQVGVEQSIYRSVLWQSGAIEVVPDIVAKVAANDGRTFQSKFWRDIPDPDDTDGTGNVIYPDDSDDLVRTTNIADGEFMMHKNGPVAAFGEKDITRLFGFLDDPLGVISDRVQFFWGKYFDKYAVAQMNGILADNIANDSGDMVNDISDATAAADAASTISPTAVIDAQMTAGDTYADFSTMIVHSVVMASLRKQNLIDTIPDARGETFFEFYQNLRILVSDNVPVDTTGANPVYTTLIIAPNVLGFGSSTAGLVPSELWRDPRSGLGAGETQLITRQAFALHPAGFSWQDAAVNGSTAQTSGDAIYPNLADNADAANWDRIVTNRKQVRIAAILSNA